MADVFIKPAARKRAEQLVAFVARGGQLSPGALEALTNAVATDLAAADQEAVNSSLAPL